MQRQGETLEREILDSGILRREKRVRYRRYRFLGKSVGREIVEVLPRGFRDLLVDATKEWFVHRREAEGNDSVTGKLELASSFSSISRSRYDSLSGSQLFDKLKKERASCFEKLIAVRGDTSVEGLGLTTTDREMIVDRVSIIFHVAANVRFDKNLKKDIFSNTRSTRDVCVMAGNMKNLVVSSLLPLDCLVGKDEKLRRIEGISRKLRWRKVIHVCRLCQRLCCTSAPLSHIPTSPRSTRSCIPS